MNTLPNQGARCSTCGTYICCCCPRQSQKEHADLVAESSFTPIDSVARIVSDIINAGYSAWMIAGGFRTDMPDDVYRSFMAQRGFVCDE